MKTVIHSLTGFRFILSTQVVLLHFVANKLHNAPLWLSTLVHNGYVGVNGFFVLSGFVNMLQSNPKDYRTYVWNKLVRLYPVYLLAILSQLLFTAEEVRVLPTVATLLLVQSWIPSIKEYLLAPAWSLSVELFFILSFPWIRRALPFRRHAFGILMGAYLVGCALGFSFKLVNPNSDRKSVV